MNKQIQNLKDKIWADEYWTKPNTDKLLPAKLTSSMQQGYNVVLVLNKEEIIWQLPNFG